MCIHIPCLLPIMGVSWTSLLTLHIAWCTPLCITIVGRTRTSSTQQPVLQGCTHIPPCAAPCFSTWIRIQSTGRTYEGSCLIIPCIAQYRSLFPEIITPCNHQRQLIDHNSGEPYHIATAADFCLMDPLFPSSPGDSLLFKEDDLVRLKRKGYYISTYMEEKPQPTFPKEDKHMSSCIKKNVLSSPAKRRNHARPAA